MNNNVTEDTLKCKDKVRIIGVNESIEEDYHTCREVRAFIGEIGILDTSNIDDNGNPLYESYPDLIVLNKEDALLLKDYKVKKLSFFE